MAAAFRTLAVHGEEPQHYAHDSLTLPIVQSATYSFENTAALIDYMEGRREHHEYGRYDNPTTRMLEKRLSSLEGAEDALLFSSGMAAVTTAILALTHRGAHVVLFADCYRRTRQFVMQVLSKFGVEHTLVPPTDLAALGQAIRPETRLVISEAPTNPYQTVVDLEGLSELCRSRRVKTLIDSTFATPVNMQPIRHGVDLVLHSATKYLAGHNDVLGGVLAGSYGLISLVRDLRHVFGGICDPHAAYLIHRGVKTLALRVEHQNKSALALACALEKAPQVERVWYPGLPSHPHHEVAKKYLKGFGGVVTFLVKADMKGTGRFVDACRIPRIAPSLGGVESLIEQPALMSYFELSSAEREAIGIRDNLVRYSVGVEDTQELIEDVLSALPRVSE